MLGRGVAERLGEIDPPEVWSPELRQLCAPLDLVVANLECCLSARGEPTRLMPGKPFFFRGPPDPGTAALRALGVGAVSLANNHLLDYGEEAARDTPVALEATGIDHAGAGGDPREARRRVVVQASDRRVGLVCASDHPDAYAAARGRFGIAHADLDRGPPDWLLHELEQAREECDHVVAFLHWGPNMTTSPARWQRTAAETLVEAGADLVAGHSAHVPHGVGWGPRGPLLYDLGDALDDYAVDAELRNDLGVLAVWRPHAGPDAELELWLLCLEYARTGLASGSDAERLAERLTSACAELGTRAERAEEACLRVRPAQSSA